MWHTHPFYHSYTHYSNSSVSSKSSKTLRITPSKVGLHNATFAIQYLKSYKSSLNKLKQMDIVLDKKAKGHLAS